MKNHLLMFILVISALHAGAQCTNTSPYATINAPTSFNTSQIGSCHYATENSQIVNMIAGQVYQFTSSVGSDYFTVTQGSAGGPVMTHGGNPLFFTPTSTGNYYLHVTAGANCQHNSGCRQIYCSHMNCSTAPPAISVAVSHPTVCAGKTVTFTASGATTAYTWFPGGISANPVTAAPASNSQFTVIAGVAPCISSRIFSVAVSSGPVISAYASHNSVCANANFTLLAYGANSYTWYPGAITGGSIITSQTQATTYTVLGAISAGCPGADLIAVNLLPSPTISASATKNAVCAGSTTTLNASGAQGYTWSPGSFTLSTFTVSPASTTNYTVAGSGSNGCIATKIVSITAHPLPSITLTPAKPIICIGESNTITASGALSYKWLSDFTTNPTLVVTATSTLGNNYSVLGTDNNGCQKEESITLTVIECADFTSVAGEKADLLPQVFPNPSNGTFSVSGNDQTAMELISASGQVVAMIPAGEKNVSVTNLPDGIYVLKTAGAAAGFRKIVISR